MKPKPAPDVEERVIPSEKTENILDELRQALLKRNTVKHFILVIQLRFSCVRNCDKKLIKINDLSDGQYSVNKNIRFKTPMLRLDLRKYKDAYTLVNEIITVTDTNNDSRQNKKLVFKNNATFISCTEKNNNTFLDNAKDLDIVIPMYNLLRHSGNYSITLGSMWHY